MNNNQINIELMNDNSKIDLEIMNFLKKKKHMPMPKPSKLRISTRSATSNISSPINLNKLAIILAQNIKNNILKKENVNYLIKGICMKNLVLNTIEKKKKKNNVTINNLDVVLASLINYSRLHFYNQCSIIVKPDLNRRPVNIKLFSNGAISLTGCKEDNDGIDAIEVLLKELKNYPEVFVNENKEAIRITKYKITMINSDYQLNFKIDRKKLYNILKATNLLVMYEPETYPGVKIYYYWNTSNKDNNGICVCKDIKRLRNGKTNYKKCNGKGNGYGNTECKKVTIAVFQSGSVIITGARSELQIKHAYERINSIIKNNYKNIVKNSIEDFMKEQLLNVDIEEEVNNAFVEVVQ